MSMKKCNYCGVMMPRENVICTECGGNNDPSSSEHVDDTKYAGFWRRALAIFIDGIILNLGMALLGFNEFAGIVITWLYFAGLESSHLQGTLGKHIIGIKVTDIHGRRITFMRATGRYFGSILSALIIFIGYIMAGFTEKKQALHDIMAETLVVVQSEDVGEAN